jgi:hypothetical protein
MFRTLKLIFVLILLAGWGLFALTVHVVRLTDEQYWVGVIPKDRLHYRDTYLDVRNWTVDDVAAHPDFVRRLIATGKGHWLKHVVGPERLPGLLEEGLAATRGS